MRTTNYFLGPSVTRAEAGCEGPPPACTACGRPRLYTEMPDIGPQPAWTCRPSPMTCLMKHLASSFCQRVFAPSAWALRLALLSVAIPLAHAQPANEIRSSPDATAIFTPRVVEKTAAPVDMDEVGRQPETALRNGVRATKAQCERIGNGLWAVSGTDETACIRYWAAGLESGTPAKRAVVYFSGDVWSGGRAVATYAKTSDESLAKAAAQWAQRLGLPYVFMARPGTYGSSGDHMERRRPAESRLLSAALDVLKTRLGVSEYIVAGFSGGGHVASALVTLRSDVVCAVPGGAPSSPRMRWELKRWAVDATGYSDSYEPTLHLNKATTHPRLRVFIVGDPRDREGLWPAQTVMAQAAREKGIAAEIIEVQGSAPDFHNGQGEIVRLVSGWCGTDLSTEEIVQRAWGYRERQRP